MKIAVVVPVYHEPKKTGDIIRKFFDNDYPEKEIYIVIDGETNELIEAAFSPFRERLHLSYNNKRLGKVNSLNRVTYEINADLLLFLDNDIVLPDDTRYLSKIAKFMENHDIAELPKEAIVSSFISAMINYEFIGYAISSLIVANLSHRCPFLNGAAFIIRQPLFNRLEGFRSVVNEDNDISSRAFRLDARFGFDPSLKVKNEVPSTVREWLKQRRRWALNNIYWLKDHFIHVFLKMFRSPRLFLSFLFLIMPIAAFILVFLLARHTHMTALLPFIFMHFQHYNVISGAFLWYTHYRLIATEGIIPTISGLLISTGITFIFSRILKFRFNFLDYILFYFVYSPIWFIINIIMWVLVIFKIEIDLDWKI